MHLILGSRCDKDDVNLILGSNVRNVLCHAQVGVRIVYGKKRTKCTLSRITGRLRNVCRSEGTDD